MKKGRIICLNGGETSSAEALQDREETQSEEQAALMAPDIDYALRVETDWYSPAECAGQIIRALMQ